MCGWRIIASEDRAGKTRRRRFSAPPTSALRGGPLGADVRFRSGVEDGLLRQSHEMEWRNTFLPRLGD